MYMECNGRTLSVSKLMGSASHTGKMKDSIHCLRGNKATVVKPFSTILKNVLKRKTLNQNIASQFRALLDFVPYCCVLQTDVQKYDGCRMKNALTCVFELRDTT